MTREKAEQEPGFVRLSLVAPFVEYVRRQGTNPELAFAAVGLSEASAKDPNVFVRAELVYSLLSRFAEQVGDRYLGARVGAAHDFSQWPPFAVAAESSRTLVEFYSAFIRLVPTEASSVEHSLQIGTETATYRIARKIKSSVRPVQVTGFGCAHYVRILRAVAGEAWDPSEVSFESLHIDGVPPGYAGIETRTSRDPGMLLRFPVEWLFLDLQLDLRAMRQTPLDKVEEPDLVLALRSAVSEHLDTPDLGTDRVAQLLGIEPAYLTKALMRSNTTVPREVKRLKIDVAKARLRDTEDSIREIAGALGYTHQAHFTRFFLSQSGQTPSDFRRHSTRSD